MARSTFKVLFYVNGSKEKNGIVPIMGRVTINGSVAQFSCKQTIVHTSAISINPNRSLENVSCHFLMTAIRKTALYMFGL